MARKTQFRLLVALTLVWGLWTVWSLVGGATPYTLRVLDDLGSPVVGAVVDVDGKQVGTSDEIGVVEMEWSRSATVLEVSAPGHIDQMVTLADRPSSVIDVVIKARILRGRIVDEDGLPLQAAVISAGPAQGSTDGDGYFQIRGAEPGTLAISRPAWIDTTAQWDGGPGETVITMTPFAARAVHISGEAMADLDRFIEMANSTELNALMIDLKDESGLVWYNSSDSTALEVGAVRSIYDLTEALEKAHANNLYVIGRIVAFSDPTAAIKKPSMAVWDSETNSPYSARGQYFLDPTDPDARAYAMELAVEVCSMGIDEVQFDYVRFPDARSGSAKFDGGVSQDVRIATISSFLSEAVLTLHPFGCAVAADVFGFTTRAEDDGGIGQRWPDIASIVDVASPMVYPSHYSTGWYGFDNPNDHPGPMVTNALKNGLDRLPRTVVVRPWLQDFGYTADQVRAQIESTEAFGLGWMLWNAASNVTTSALDPE